MAEYTTAAKEYGAVSYEGKTLALTQQAYASNYGTFGGVVYKAHAIDEEGNVYTVTWQTTEEWDNAEPDSAIFNDESNACDWDNPYDVIAL